MLISVICTGRPLYSIQRALSSDLYDYAVLNNGMQSAKNNGEIIEDKRKLLPEEIREITRCCERFNVMMSVSYDDDFHHFTSKKHHLYVSSVQKLKNLARKILGRKLWHDDMHSVKPADNIRIDPVAKSLPLCKLHLVKNLQYPISGK